MTTSTKQVKNTTKEARENANIIYTYASHNIGVATCFVNLTNHDSMLHFANAETDLSTLESIYIQCVAQGYTAAAWYFIGPINMKPPKSTNTLLMDRIDGDHRILCFSTETVPEDMKAGAMADAALIYEAELKPWLGL